MSIREKLISKGFSWSMWVVILPLVIVLGYTLFTNWTMKTEYKSVLESNKELTKQIEEVTEYSLEIDREIKLLTESAILKDNQAKRDRIKRVLAEEETLKTLLRLDSIRFEIFNEKYNRASNDEIKKYFDERFNN